MLLVEDEPFVREATGRILQGAGFQVLAASDAQDAMRAYEENQCRIDLLMSDLGLPGRTGRELGSDIRRRMPGIPILLTSGYLSGEDGEGSTEEHTYYLPKPYSRADLLKKLSQIFDLTLRGNAARAG